MIKKIVLILIFFIIFFTYSSNGYSSEHRAYIGIVPYYSPEKIWKLFKPFIDYLNKETDRIKWELRLYHKAKDVIDGLCSGEIDIALLGPIPAAQSYEKCKAKPILVSLGSDGKASYRGVIITNDQNINSLKELKGKRFAFFKGSTISYFMARHMLEKEGITMEMIKPVFIQGQDGIVASLFNNEVVAGTIKESLYEKIKDSGLRVIKFSEPIPMFSFFTNPNIKPNIEREFVRSLLKLKPLENKSDKIKLKEWDDEVKNGFILPSEGFLNSILDLYQIKKKYEDKDQ